MHTLWGTEGMLLAGAAQYAGGIWKRKRPVTDGGCRRAQEARRYWGIVDAGRATRDMPRI